MSPLFRLNAGDGVLFVGPDLPDDAPAAVREGIVRRRLTMIEGRCPCGATFHLPNRAERRRSPLGVRWVTVEHEDDCPAVDAHLQAAFDAWGRGL